MTYLAATAASSADPRQLSGTLLHSVGGLVVLLVTVIPSVFEPRRVTRYGWRKQNELRQDIRARRTMRTPEKRGMPVPVVAGPSNLRVPGGMPPATQAICDNPLTIG